mgnify:CR=1 FL=1
MIERISLDETCPLGMPCPSSTCGTDGIYRYTESGLWYDAIACLVELIEQEFDKDRLRRMLDHLLHQSGVHLRESPHRNRDIRHHSWVPSSLAVNGSRRRPITAAWS